MTRVRVRSAGGFLLLAAVWGLSFVAARAAVASVPPVTLAALRFDVAGVAMVAYAAATVERWRPRTRDEWRVAAVAGGLFVAAHHALLFAGQQYVTSAVAGVVVSLDPVLAAAFAWLLLPDERPDATTLAGVCLGLVGAAVVAAPDPGRLARADHRGVALVFGAAAAFALGAVLVRRFRAPALPARTVQAWGMVLGAPLLHVVAVPLPGEGLRAATWTPAAVWGLAYLAVVAGAGGYLLYFGLLDRLGPVTVNLVGYVAPAFAALGGWLLLGERVTASTAVGFAVIVAGFAVVERASIREALARHRPGTGSE